MNDGYLYNCIYEYAASLLIIFSPERSAGFECVGRCVRASASGKGRRGVRSRGYVYGLMASNLLKLFTYMVYLFISYFISLISYVQVFLNLLICVVVFCHFRFEFITCSHFRGRTDTHIYIRSCVCIYVYMYPCI